MILLPHDGQIRSETIVLSSWCMTAFLSLAGAGFAGIQAVDIKWVDLKVGACALCETERRFAHACYLMNRLGENQR